MENNLQPSPDEALYCRCGDCGKILPQQQWKAQGDDAPAPCCGKAGVSRSYWPPSAVSRLLAAVRAQEEDSFSNFEVNSAFLCFAMELIVENILIERIKAFPGGENKPAATIVTARNFDSLMKVYEKLSGKSMANFFESIGAGTFMSEIIQVFTLREAITLDNQHKAQKMEKRAVASVRDWCLKYFSMLNNNLYSRRVDKLETAEKQRTKSILVVDDELVVLDMMCRLVKRQGLEAYGAATGSDGLRLYKENMPDCVFLDVALPDRDGLSVLREIRAINPAAEVYLVTGIGGEAFEKEVKKLGNAGYISKPVDHAVITSIIKNVLSR